MDKIDLKILHYTTNGEKLAGFDVLNAGCNDGRGLTYDQRDHSIWIVNHSPHKMIHIDKRGKELPGSFYFDRKLGLPDAVCLDTINYEFWVGIYGRKM